jgi:hypothetical protein
MNCVLCGLWILSNRTFGSIYCRVQLGRGGGGGGILGVDKKKTIVLCCVVKEGLREQHKYNNQ